MSDHSVERVQEGPSESFSSLGSITENLFAVIDRDNVHGLNLTIPEAAKDTIKPWNERESTEKYADSNVDDQMIIHIPFSQNVRVRSLFLKLGRGEFTPRHLRVYANYPNIIDFADAEGTKPVLNISLLEGETAVTEYPLRVAAFANVTSLSLFFSESIGGDCSRVYYIGFKGEARIARKPGTTKIEIPAANAPDVTLTDRLSEKTAAPQPTAK
ncbi:hypothetical protein EW146_g4462 [Bondarzewia mesenterica]|uniref:PITH domain-containing protein n=1 Tax=Bondarzewia mesenterica TaxID=1095465 RepID=A0A4S4LUH4_9AGAM|nr:hypothetical protein EW146_g4462 [Bondarzewia mesenterica]